MVADGSNPQGDGSLGSSDGALGIDVVIDGFGEGTGACDGPCTMDGSNGSDSAGATADGGDGGIPDDGYMRGGGCSCSVSSDRGVGAPGWLLFGLGAVVRALRRKGVRAGTRKR
jgi:MYXO-CTERM domain-containing protein